MTIDLAGALRRIKPERRLAQLRPRPVDELDSAEEIAGVKAFAMVPDTNVYIRSTAGTVSDAVAGLLDDGLLFHCSVCLAELATGMGNADPAHPQWRQTRDHYRSLVGKIPETRILTPDTQIWTEAGLIAGVLARTQNLQRHQRKECLNDALILLTATKAGLPVLTADRDDFDLIQQLVPPGRFLYF